MKHFLNITLLGAFLMSFSLVYAADTVDWRKGIVTQEFLYTKAPFPECHAATIAETPKGLVVAFFGGTKERNPDVCIWVCRQENGQWTVPEKVADGIVDENLRYPCWNPVLYQVPGGELLLFYKVGPKPSTWKGYVRRSKDNGLTWSDAEILPEGIIGPVKNKPVQVNGHLLCPSSTENDGWRIHIEETSDNGRTWQQTGPLNDAKKWSVIQPTLLTYQGDSLQMLCRSRNRAIASLWSYDKGKTWSAIDSIGLPNNNSGIDGVTLQDGRQLLVYNHVLPPDGKVKGPRTPLNVALSQDGFTWYASLVLEDSPISQYSYPSVIQSKDGYVHIVYTWRRQRIRYVKIDPRKLQMKKIENGLWPGHETAKIAKNAGETPYPISVCDWMLLKRQKNGAITLAREIGCDGLETDMGSLSKNYTFQSRFKDNPEELQRYKQLARQNRVRISSVAMSGFYAQSFAERESYIQPVADCIDVMKGLGVKVAFLPLGVPSDLVKHPELRPKVIERLRTVGKMAEDSGVIIGIETALDAAGDKKLLEDIGCPAIKIYFNFSNALQNGRDLDKELRILGAENICMIHCTNQDRVWLQNDTMIDMPAIKKTLEEIGYHGWLVMERSRDATQSRNVRGNYGANCAYLKKVFQPE